MIRKNSMSFGFDFYTTVLGFEKLSDIEVWDEEQERLRGLFGLRARVVRLALGDEVVELTDYLTAGGRSLPADSQSNDGWFQHSAIVVSDMDRAYARLREHRVVHASTGPQRRPDWNPNAGGIQAFYFRDPDGHFLEVLQFPPGKGEPRWQLRDRLFLGIDHTAVVSTDTERSLRFYRDGLGLTVAGGALNHGVEQEHLNVNSFNGIRIEISGTRPVNQPPSKVSFSTSSPIGKRSAGSSARFWTEAVLPCLSRSWIVKA